MTKLESTTAVRWLSPLVDSLAAKKVGRWWEVEGVFAGTFRLRFQTLDQVRSFIRDPLLDCMAEVCRQAA